MGVPRFLMGEGASSEKLVTKRPPHPNPLPQGERERTELVAAAGAIPFLTVATATSGGPA
jgi:hypothetical protein